MPRKKPIRRLLIMFAATLTVIGSLFLLFVVGYTFSPAEKVIGCVTAAAILLISGVLWYIIALSFGKKENVFLDDNKHKRTLKADELTFDSVYEKLSLYFGIVLSQKQSRFTAWLEKRYDAGMPEVYRPLFLPFLLYEIIEADSDDAWRTFGTLPKETVDLMENALVESGEDAVSSRIQYLKATYEEDPGRFRDFFLDKKQYLQDFMVSYVKKNIARF